jgi:hypothetical protein
MDNKAKAFGSGETAAAIGMPRATLLEWCRQGSVFAGKRRGEANEFSAADVAYLAALRALTMEHGFGVTRAARILDEAIEEQPAVWAKRAPITEHLFVTTLEYHDRPDWNQSAVLFHWDQVRIFAEEPPTGAQVSRDGEGPENDPKPSVRTMDIGPRVAAALAALRASARLE